MPAHVKVHKPRHNVAAGAAFRSLHFRVRECERVDAKAVAMLLTEMVEFEAQQQSHWAAELLVTVVPSFVLAPPGHIVPPQVEKSGIW